VYIYNAMTSISLLKSSYNLPLLSRLYGAPKQYQMGSNLVHLILDQADLSQFIPLQSLILLPQQGIGPISILNNVVAHQSPYNCTLKEQQIVEVHSTRKKSSESSSIGHRREPPEEFNFWSVSRSSIQMV
jgi:hypothetical protein